MKRWFEAHRNNLGVQLLALYLLLIVPFLVALLVVDGLIGERIKADAEANDLALARAIAQETDFTLSNAIQAVQELATYPAVIEGDPQGMERLFDVILKTRPDVRLVYRLDENGIMLYHSPVGEQPTTGMDFSFREYFKRALKTNQPFISQGRISPTTDQPVATAVMPLWSDDGQFLGLVGMNIGLESLSHTLATVIVERETGHDIQVIILDTSTQVIAYTDPQYLLYKASSLLPDIYSPALAGKSGAVVKNDLSGSPHLYSYAPIQRANWGVIVSRPTATAFATQIIMHRIALGVAIAFLLIGLVFWFTLTQRVIRPIEQLVPISETIGQNQPINQEQKQHLEKMSERGDQIGQLIRSVLNMQDSIATRIREQKTLLETSTAVVSSLDPQTVLERILEQVERLLDVRMSAIVALDEKRGIFRARASRGLSKRYSQELTIQPTEPLSLTMRALHSKKPLQISDTETDPTFAKNLYRSRTEGFRAILSVPLNTQYAPPSALLVYKHEPHVFTENEIQLAVSFANHAAMAIENAVLYSRSGTRLQEQTRRLEALVESLHDGLILSDLNGQVVYANHRIADLSGLTQEFLSGSPADMVLMRIIEKAPEPDSIRHVIQYLLESSGGYRTEITLIHFGQTIHLRLQTFEVTDAHNVPIGHGLILQDITADRELDRMRSGLVSTVSHELRTPLAAIKGYASTLLADDVEWDKESQKEFLTIISDEVDRLSNLVNDLLDLSRIETGNLRLSRNECQLDDLIQRAAERAQVQSSNQFEVQLEPDLPTLYADAQRLETVLRNLIENAVKYAGPEAQIRVAVKHQDNSLVFRVTDDGPGIPAEESQRVFASFYRINDDLTRLATGTGLGLAICQGLVRAHGGDIWVEPKEKGACIAFSIPLTNDQFHSK
jgi:PAS domain S-box-containing protein